MQSDEPCKLAKKKPNFSQLRIANINRAGNYIIYEKLSASFLLFYTLTLTLFRRFVLFYKFVAVDDLRANVIEIA